MLKISLYAIYKGILCDQSTIINFSAFFDKEIKKACNYSQLVLHLGYRQVTLFHNKYRIVHAL